MLDLSYEEGQTIKREMVLGQQPHSQADKWVKACNLPAGAHYGKQ